MSTASITDFEIMKRLGEGSFGSVYMVRRKSDEKIYAMKKVKMLSLSTKEKENALNEVRILASIKSANIISYKDAFYDEGSSSLCIIMDFAAKGDVLMQINEKKKTKGFFQEAIVWKYAADMLLGLKALHDKKILHRDLKGANVFISEEGSLKLGDLNVSKVQKRDYAHTQTGTPYYTSPEVWQNRPYDSKCDVWSLGCVLYEIITLEPPFKGTSMEDLYKKVLKGTFAPINLQRYSSDLQKFVESCLRVDPKQRSSVDGLLVHKNIMPHIDLDTIAKNDRDRKKNAPPDLLQTIKLPYGGLKGLNKHLPKANYDAPDEKHTEEAEEVKSEQITQKKKVEEPQRPVSAVSAKSSQSKKIEIPTGQIAGTPVLSRPRDLSSGHGQAAQQYYQPQYGLQQQQPGVRQLSAQPQVKRVLSHGDIFAAQNQGRNHMPALVSPINQNGKQNLLYNNNNNNINSNNLPPYAMNHPYNQPRVSVHQEKDSGFNPPMRRNLSRDNIPLNPLPPSMMKKPEEYANYNRPISNQQLPPSRNPALMAPAGRGSVQQAAGLPPRYRNY